MFSKLRKLPIFGQVGIGVGGLAIIAAAVIAVVHFSSVKASYRTIAVHEVEGTAEVERNANIMNAFAGMQLKSEDGAETKEESYLQLKLDDDKYIMLDPSTKIKLVAEGTKEDSRTTIELTQGAIVNRIENKLSQDSSYEVNLPNATMAVRGTIFRCEVFINDKGERLALLSVVEGSVELILLDGPNKTPGTKVVIKAGQEVLIAEDDQKIPYIVGDPVEPELRDWSVKELEFVVEGINNRNANGGNGNGPDGNGGGNGGGGNAAYISVDDLQGLIDELNLDEDYTPQGAAGRYMDMDIPDHNTVVADNTEGGEDTESDSFGNSSDTDSSSDSNLSQGDNLADINEQPDNNEPAIDDNNRDQTQDQDDQPAINDDDNDDDDDRQQQIDNPDDEDDDKNKDKDKDKEDDKTDDTQDDNTDDQTDDNTDDQTDDQTDDNTNNTDNTNNNDSGNNNNNNNNNSGTTSDDITVVFEYPGGMTASKTVTSGPSVTVGDFPTLSGSEAGDWYWYDNEEAPAHTTDLVVDHVEAYTENNVTKYIARLHWIH